MLGHYADHESVSKSINRGAICAYPIKSFAIRSSHVPGKDRMNDKALSSTVLYRLMDSGVVGGMSRLGANDDVRGSRDRKTLCTAITCR